MAKATIDDLAIFGGPPLSADPLHVGRPNIADRESLRALLDEAMDRHWLSNDGPLVREFERRFALFTDTRNAVAVANATLGLQLAAVALGARGEIIMPSFTFIGTAHAFEWIGLKPRFVDVLPQSHTIDPGQVARAIGPTTGAIVGVHLWGGTCEVEALTDVADAHGIPLIFDAAHATGSLHNGRRVGGFGRAEVFSLHATKAVNALEAGMITTDDDALADELRLLRNYSIQDEDVVVGPGINAKLNEFSAAMGLANLEHFDRIRAHNEAILAGYAEGLDGADGATIVDVGRGDAHSHHYVVLAIDDASVDRDTLWRVLRSENIYARRYFKPGCHHSPPYNRGPVPDLPITDRLCETLLQLPTGFQLDRAMARSIGAFIAMCLEEGSALTTRLSAGLPQT